MLTDTEKLELINSMEIIEHSIGNSEVEYVLVEDNETNREVLHKIGMTDQEIDDERSPEDDTLDITTVAFTRTDANWYDGKQSQFIR